jgi:branched-chain amino acid aminotransferase
LAEFIYNGKKFQSDQPVFTLQNRAFRYGDGLFESFRTIKGRFLFLDQHLQRLANGAKFLKIELPEFFNIEIITEQCKNLITEDSDYRFRISVFRRDGGMYAPLSNEADFTIEAVKLDDWGFVFNEKGLVVDFYEELKKPCNTLSNIKSINSLYSVMASVYKNEKGLDDCIILNDRNFLAETTISNIWMVKENVIYTPSIADGGVGGTMKQIIMETTSGFKVQEKSISVDELLNADEVFTSNAVQGIRWVGKCRERDYDYKVSKALFEKLRAM